VLDALAQRDLPIEDVWRSIEGEVRYANISIIEGNDASQYGIAMVSARIAEISSAMGKPSSRLEPTIRSTASRCPFPP
jgi:hypothetical protein